ncbi:hypothetical protein BJ742DRAFT_789010 [Cladochytrium replicatum]|nr:hypothetical protein BJ742DRAFT_789010 [Cladochytrium replicatum]
MHLRSATKRAFAAEISRSHFLEISNEIFCMIISHISDLSTLSALLQTCRQISTEMKPSTTWTQQFWARIRLSHNWPDPNLIGLNDFQFLKAYYGRWCNNCVNQPRARKFYWAFNGIPLCDDCLKRVTIELSQLKQQLPHDRYAYLPSILIHGHGRQRMRTLYLASNILDHSPTEDEIKAMKLRRTRVEQFQRIFDKSVTQVEALKHEEFRKSHKSAIHKYLNAAYPVVTPQMYGKLECYRKAVDSVTPFTARTRSVFAKKFKQELEASKHHIIDGQYNYFLGLVRKRVLGDTKMAFRFRNKHNSIVASLEQIPTAEEVTALIAPLISEELEEQSQTPYQLAEKL